MRSLVLLTTAFATLIAANGETVRAQTVTTAATSTYVCPKCGKIHTRSATPVSGNAYTNSVSYPNPATYTAPTTVAAPSSGVAQVAYSQSSAGASYSGGGTQNVLQMLNSQRARQGLRSLRYDGQLQAVAQRRVQMMASSGMKSHPPGSFAPGRFEGVGWSSSFSPSGVSACYTSDPNMTAAGAAMARGRDGVYFAVVYR